MSIELRGVSKRFRKTCALEDVSLTLESGQIYGLLGRNGAGKTTLLNLISNRVFPDQGEILLDGENPAGRDEALGKLFYVGEQTFYPAAMAVRDVFRWTGRFFSGFDAGQAGRLCNRFGLDPKLRLAHLSTGHRSIVKFILALSAGTPYVLLDEPVLGLDAGQRERLYQELRGAQSRQPRTVVLATHLIEEVAGVLDQVIILKRGRVVIHQPLSALLEQGYTVSGVAGAVDAFALGREKLGEDCLGGLKSATFLGSPPETLPEGMELSPLGLQRLFLRLTGEEEKP